MNENREKTPIHVRRLGTDLIAEKRKGGFVGLKNLVRLIKHNLPPYLQRR